MKTYIIKGTYTKKGEKHAFTKEEKASNEKLATEKIYADFGGKNNLKRKNIIIEEIKAGK